MSNLIVTKIPIKKERKTLQKPVVLNKIKDAWLLKYMKKIGLFSEITRLLWEYAIKYLLNDDETLLETLHRLNHEKVVK